MDRAPDAHGALDVLATQSFIDPARVIVPGIAKAVAVAFLAMLERQPAATG